MFVIKARYNGYEYAEVIDSFGDKAEAEAMVKEYQMAFGPSWSIWLEERDF